MATHGLRLYSSVLLWFSAAAAATIMNIKNAKKTFEALEKNNHSQHLVQQQQHAWQSPGVVGSPTASLLLLPRDNYLLTVAWIIPESTNFVGNAACLVSFGIELLHVSVSYWFTSLQPVGVALWADWFTRWGGAYISRGSVVTCLTCGGIFCKFPCECVSGRILKTGR